MEITIRPETEEDYKEITKLHDLAFNRINEGKLVKNLRKTKSFISELSLVAEYKNTIIGHILFYPIKIIAENRKCGSLTLAPLSVLPAYQNKGVGSKLIERGLATAKKLGFKSVVVLGHSWYYPKFGFEVASKWGVYSPFDVPEEAFFVLELIRNGLKNCRGRVEFPKEFIDSI